jgi:citrate lyase subunit beta / citryl-CoA lyase
MRPYRSLLFVPGNRADWVRKAARAGTDAVILDLEDSVPHAEKAQARLDVTKSIELLRSEYPHTGVLVRPNALDTEHFALDVQAAIQPGVHALLLPKVCGRDDVVAYATLVLAAELAREMQPGGVALVPSLETARGLMAVEELAASPRVGALMVAAARDADVSRDVGFVWTRAGLETLYYRSRAVLASRAAGLRYIMCGLWQEIADLDGLRAFARANRELGFGGQVVIHPSHVGPVNEAYAPSPSELARFRQMIEIYEKAEADGRGAAMFEGEHIDIAHVKTARDALALFEANAEGEGK